MTHPFTIGNGSLVALPTPFRTGGVDENALAALAERQIACGTAGLVVCGSTGEAPALSEHEHAHALGCVVAATAGRIPVIAGCGAPNTAHAERLARIALVGGADALLCATPPYVKPTQAGLIAHVEAVAEAGRLPMVLYDVPSRCGVAIADATIATLWHRGRIVAVKDATGDLTRIARLRKSCGTELLQLSGEDALIAGYRAMGGQGCVSVTANVTPALCARLHAAANAGRSAEVTQIDAILAPMHAALFAESNPIPVKAALSLLQLSSDEMRLPLTQATRETYCRLKDVLETVMPQEKAAQAALQPLYLSARKVAA